MWGGVYAMPPASCSLHAPLEPEAGTSVHTERRGQGSCSWNGELASFQSRTHEDPRYSEITNNQNTSHVDAPGLKSFASSFDLSLNYFAKFKVVSLQNFV